jgi:hypothetical protein
MSDYELDGDRTLAIVDAALESGRASASDPLERELQELALAIEAESPLPDEAFARELGERVSAGFPRSGAAPARPARRPGARLERATRGRLLALGGAVACLLVVVGLAVSLSEPTRDRLAGGGETTTSDALTAEPARPNAATERDRAFSGAARSAIAPREPERRIERAAQLTLTAPGDELESVADDVVAVTDRHRGFVLRSSVSSGDGPATGGSFELRVPAAELQPALRDLSRLAHVRARSQSGQDVTPAFVSARERLADARAERRSLRRRLAAADTDERAEALRRQLDRMSLRIGSLRDELRSVRERTDYSAISVTLERRSGAAAPGGTRGALDDGLDNLEGALNLTLRALGVVLPLALAAWLAWLTATLLRRRRREAALR